LHDPALSDLGFGQQCNELAKYLQTELPIAQKIDLIVISPMRRTLRKDNSLAKKKELFLSQSLGTLVSLHSHHAPSRETALLSSFIKFEKLPRIFFPLSSLSHFSTETDSSQRRLSKAWDGSWNEEFLSFSVLNGKRTQTSLVILEVKYQ
jgi:hypothetical protein